LILIDAEQVRRGWVQPIARASPRPAAHRRCAALFEQHVALCQTVRPVMHRLRDIIKEELA
jgi:ribulokinase